MQLITTKRLATVRQMPDLYPSFTENAIRWLIFKGPINGFRRCVRKVGRRVFLDLDSFEEWIDEQKER